MPPIGWTLIYGVLTIMTMCLAWKRSEDTRAASVVLGITWTVTNASYYWMPFPDNRFFPVMDAVCAWTLGWIWRRRLEPWMAAILALFAAQVAWHVHYFHGGDTSAAAAYRYDLVLNLLYIGQLCALAWGATHDRRIHVQTHLGD